MAYELSGTKLIQPTEASQKLDSALNQVAMLLRQRSKDANSIANIERNYGFLEIEANTFRWQINMVTYERITGLINDVNK